MLSPRTLALAAMQRQEARLLLGICLTMLQQMPLLGAKPSIFRSRMRGAQMASLKTLKTHVKMFNGGGGAGTGAGVGAGGVAGAGLGAGWPDTRENKSKLKRTRSAHGTRDFAAMFRTRGGGWFACFVFGIYKRNRRLERQLAVGFILWRQLGRGKIWTHHYSMGGTTVSELTQFNEILFNTVNFKSLGFLP